MSTDAKALARGDRARDEVGVMDDTERRLRNFASDLSRVTPARCASGASDIGWEEIAFLAEGLAFGPRALHAAAAKVTERHNLGPRGAWILNVITHGIVYPLELSQIFEVGRSLITAELARLTEAGLVDARPGKDDRRKTELTLTPLGEAVSAEVRAELSAIVRRRLAGFDAAEARIAAEVFRALSREPDAPLD